MDLELELFGDPKDKSGIFCQFLSAFNNNYNLKMVTMFVFLFLGFAKANEP